MSLYTLHGGKREVVKAKTAHKHFHSASKKFASFAARDANALVFVVMQVMLAKVQGTGVKM